MKKLLLLMLLLFVSQSNVYAFQYIDETYTGRKVIKSDDTPLYPPGYYDTSGSGSLGGSSHNYQELSASQFTIEQPDIVNYLSINAVLHPLDRTYDAVRSAYIQQRKAEGATDAQIIFELDGVVGPAQSMDVNFSLIKGSLPWRGETFSPMPSEEVLATASYTFFTDNSRYDQQYSNLLIPFSPFRAELSPNDDYWILASLPNPNGTYFNYSTKLVGEVNTPEPSTMLLLGGGLAGAIWRRRKNSKV